MRWAKLSCRLLALMSDNADIAKAQAVWTAANELYDFIERSKSSATDLDVAVYQISLFASAVLAVLYSTDSPLDYDLLMKFISNSKYFINFQQLMPSAVKSLLSIYLLCYRRTSSRTVELD